MSKLYKRSSIVIGEPLRIDINSVEVTKEKRPMEQVIPEGIQAEQSPQHNKGDILKDARTKAAEITNNARIQSEKIKRNAKKEGYQKGYEEGKKEGYDDGKKKGFTEGQEKGRQQGFAAVDKTMEEALEIKRKALKEKERMVKEAEREILQLVLKISDKVLDEQVKTNPEAVLGIVKKALKKCTYSDEVTVKVSPGDYNLVERSKQRLLSKIDGITRLNIVAQEAMPQGSCVLETDAGNIASGVEVQLGKIEEAFKELLNHE